MSPETEQASPLSRSVTLALSAVLGLFGAHRFYAGRTRSGVLMLCTLGGAGLWYLYDLILVAAGSFRDSQGRLIVSWEPERVASNPPSEEVLQELSELRMEVADLAERLEFAERLLARPRNEHESPLRT